jgi:hypothetical protein
MEKFKVNVSKTPSGYCAAMEALPGWIVGVTGSFTDLKKEIKESIDFYIDCAKKHGDAYPLALAGNSGEDYELEYSFSMESLLCFYNGILSRSAIARLSGINEKQLGHYACGRSRPRPQQAAKIVNALHQLGNELLSVSV